MFVSLFVPTFARAAEDEVSVWEYSPYRVQLWYSFEPSISESATAKTWLIEQVGADLRRAFKATWKLETAPLPEHLQRDVQHRLSQLTLDDLARNELVLAISATHSKLRPVRTFQAAVETLTSVVSSTPTRRLLSDAERLFPQDSESLASRWFAKITESDQSDGDLRQSLVEAKIEAAVVPRSIVAGVDQVRMIPIPLSWQSEWVVHEYDKLIFLVVGWDGDCYRVRAREWDCPLRFAGPVFESSVHSWSSVAGQASAAIQQAFAPIARVDAAEATTALLRHRAGGLIIPDDESNPARIRVGDVLQPVVRRDDRSGAPTLIQPLQFTFAAITETDGVKMQANVYAYSGGPGLRGRQNPRIHRILLRVRPGKEPSDLHIVRRGEPQSVQTGRAVYSKDHLTDEFIYLGRTDWRGRLTIPAPEQTVEILPASLKADHAAARRAAYDAALAEATQVHDEEVRAAQAEGRDVPEFVPPAMRGGETPVDPAALIRLSAPIVQLYIKSGQTVVARLPFVPGLHEVETVELADDSLRLQSEAFVRGFQGEVLDLIGQRNLLAARIRLHVENRNMDRAKESLDQLRRLKDFNQMNAELSRIQQNILRQVDTNVPRSAQTQIDRMFKVTRDMLQKYLLDDKVAEAARLIQESTK